MLLRKLQNHYHSNDADLPLRIEEVRSYHHTITDELFAKKEHEVFFEIEKLFMTLSGFMIKNKNKGYDFVYDQIYLLLS